MAQCKCQRMAQLDHVPKEIWLAILSRLPIKSLLVSRVVCKSWNKMALSVRNKIYHLPTCGLLLDNPDSYLCLRTKKVTSFLTTDSPDKLTVMSGYEKGWLGDLSLDFGALFKISHSNPNKQECSYSICRGLLLVCLDDGTYHVHNPATREAFLVRESPGVHLFGPEEGKGAIFRQFGPPDLYSHFIVVRLFNRRRCIEFFDSRKGLWFKFPMYKGDDLRDAYWSFDNYVSLSRNNREMLFFLTDKGRGVVLKFKTREDRMAICSFALPQEIVDGGCENARLGGCVGCLYLSYFTPNGFWIWKHADDYGGLATIGTWLPLLEFSNTRKLCKPMGLQHFAEVLIAGDSVKTLGFDDGSSTVFLCINSVIYAYDMDNDTLDKIAKTNDLDNRVVVSTVTPFTPFLGVLVTPNIRLVKRKMEV